MTRSERILIISIALTFLILSVAHVLILPPYEGFDEPAHYSYISYLADRRGIPDFRSTPWDINVEQDRAGLPLPYHGYPPYEANHGLTYATFAGERNTEDHMAAVTRFWSKPQNPVNYHPGPNVIWQGQHPPFYYVIASIPYIFTKGFAPAYRLLILRLTSALIASASLLFWIAAIRLLSNRTTRAVALFSGLFMLFFPSLFYDVSRLGNDCLAMLVFSAIFYATLKTFFLNQASIKNILFLSLLVGLGLLTKLFFLAVVIGIAWLTLHFCLLKARIGSLSTLIRLACVVFVPFLVAAPWFLFFYSRYGMVFGSQQLYAYSQASETAGQLLSGSEFWLTWLKSLKSFWSAFFWSGTWSLVRIKTIAYGLILPLVLLTGYSFLKQLLKPVSRQVRSLVTISVFLVCPLILMFCWYIYSAIRNTGSASHGGGYYIFMAWTGIGIWGSVIFLEQASLPKKMITALAFLSALAFECYGWWVSMLVYSGFLVKQGTLVTGTGYLSFTVPNLLSVIDRLQELCFPVPSVGLYLLTLISRVGLIFTALFLWDSPLQSEPPPQDNALAQ